MHLVLLLATLGATLDLLLQALAGRRLRSARPFPTALFLGANVLLLVVVATVLVPAQWWLALLFLPPLALGGWVLRDWTAPARASLTFLACAAASYVAYVARLTFLSGLPPLAMLLSGVLLVFEVAALLLTVVYAYEAFAVLARVRWRRRVDAPPAFDPATAPFVSVHVATYSEPPELVIETLDALARLDYPAFEVIVVDNNTKDPTLWRPVEAHCAALGERFRFFHVDPLGGFKAGACNFALARTDPRATLIAIIDADYVVVPSFLRETTPHFRDERLAFVQTPQDYRQFAGNAYLTDCLHAYAYFFAISMLARNEDDAAIFGGTMGLIRRSALEEIGGWDEWCITEDAEASLRILARGHSSLYLARSYGHGLMPFDFDSYKKQRFRWAFGGIQIFRKHWRSLLPFWPRPAGDRLSEAQRRWYLAAAFLWSGEVIQLAFAAFLVVGGLAYAFGAGIAARPLTEAVLIFPLLFLVLGIARFLWVLRVALGIPGAMAARAMINMFSLSWVVAQAVLSAALRGEGVFLRTPKIRSRGTLRRALGSSRWESAIAASCLALGVAALARGTTALGIGLAVLCAWQATVYGSAFATSLSAIRSARLDRRPARYRRHPDRPPDRRAILWLPAAAAATSVGVLLALATVVNAPTVAIDLNQGAAQQPPLLPPAVVARPPAPPVPTATATPVTPAPVAPGGGPQPSAPPAPSAGSASAPPTPPAAQPTPPATPATPPGGQPTPPVTPPVPAGGQPSARPSAAPTGAIHGRPSGIP